MEARVFRTQFNGGQKQMLAVAPNGDIWFAWAHSISAGSGRVIGKGIPVCRITPVTGVRFFKPAAEVNSFMAGEIAMVESWTGDPAAIATIEIGGEK